MSKKYRLILMDNQEDICWVTINRPEDRNSINTELMKELEEMLSETEETTTKIIVFTGAGDTHFIGGADGIEMMQCHPDGALAFSHRIQNLFNRMEESPLILVAAINGLCFGGGYEFALACDFRIATEDARVGLPEVKVGLIPGGGGTQRLPGVVGVGRALEMILSGRLYKAKEALELGLVHRVAPPNELLAEAAQFLKPILKNPKYALSLAKRAVRTSQHMKLPDGLRVEREEFMKCFENDYFVNLMCRQIRTGILKTTAKLPDWVYEERK